MIAIIILTGFALLTLIIGFFEIRIPFVHQKTVNNAKFADSADEKKVNKQVSEAGSGLNYFRNIFRSGKSDISYRLIHPRKSTDIA